MKNVVVAYDGDGNTFEVATERLIFRPSVYGVLRKDNEILVQRNPLLSGFNLPGGGIELGEDEKTALKREFLEETGLMIQVGEILDAKTDYYTYGGQFYHCVMVFYFVEEVSGSLLTESNGDDSEEALFYPIDKLLEGEIQRVFHSVVKKLQKV